MHHRSPGIQGSAGDVLFWQMQTIGEQLKQARIHRDLTLIEVAKVTAIRAQYLKALEDDEFEVLPSAVHVRGFLRNYAAFLGLQPDALLQQLLSSEPPVSGIQKVEEGPSGTLNESVESIPKADDSLSSQPRAGNQYLDQGGDTSQVDEAKEKTAGRSQSVESTDFTEGLIFPSLPYLEEPQTKQDEFVEPAEELQQSGTIPLSRSIFIEIGQQLRLRRELLSLSIEEIERHTRISRHHLALMEDGRFEDLPSSVQARGALTTYARFIDLSTETILLRFADALQAQRSERHPLPTHRRRMRSSEGPLSSLRKFLSTDLVFGGGLVLAIAIFAIWGTARVITLRAQKTDEVNAQSISQVLLATQVGIPTPSPTTTGEPEGVGFLPAAPLLPSETPTAFPTRFSTAAVQLIVISSGRTWMRITVDGKIEFEGRTTPGNAYSFDGQKQIELLAADAGAIQLIYNRDNIGSPGNPGGVVNLIYTANAVLLPTPTITPSPTRTLRPSPTPRPTSTPRFTPTPPGTPEPIG